MGSFSHTTGPELKWLPLLLLQASGIADLNNWRCLVPNGIGSLVHALHT